MFVDRVILEFPSKLPSRHDMPETIRFAGEAMIVAWTDAASPNRLNQNVFDRVSEQAVLAYFGAQLIYDFVFDWHTEINELGTNWRPYLNQRRSFVSFCRRRTLLSHLAAAALQQFWARDGEKRARALELVNKFEIRQKLYRLDVYSPLA